MITQLKSRGYDGIEYPNGFEDASSEAQTSYMVFDPEQIKVISIDGNPVIAGRFYDPFDL